jgi:hypothetical protein
MALEDLKAAFEAERESCRTSLMEVATLYATGLQTFGGITTELPTEGPLNDVAAWMKFNFSKLPEFIGGVSDFGALAGVTSFCKLLAAHGCSHASEIRTKAMETVDSLGDLPEVVQKSIKRFMKYFWCEKGRDTAKVMSEARRAKVETKNFSSVLVVR